jgi:hypothetical protein
MARLIARPVHPPHVATVASRGNASFAAARASLADIALLLGVTAVGLLLALQGWRAHAPAFDMLPYFYGLDAFLERGTILSHGNLSSYGPFFPPGTFWLMLPGRLVFTDPRLFEKLGGAILYLGTLVGVFRFARAAFGVHCARLSVVVYGLSGLGLAFAGSLWPIGHPFFFVWMAYLATEWALRKDARYLTGAIVIWASGMYVGMAIAPAAIILPLVWLLRRPPLWSRSLVLGGAFLLVLWYPYLAFESGRAFIDIRGILLRQNIIPSDYAVAWCDANLSLRSLATINSPQVVDPTSAAVGPPTTSTVQRLLDRGGAVVYRFASTFRESVQIPGAGTVLLLVVLGSMLIVGLPALGRTRWLGAVGRRLGVVRSRFAGLPVEQPTPHGYTGAAQLLAAGLFVPWLILAFIAEPGKPERFLWLWPLQVIVLVGFVTNILPHRRPPGPIIRLGQLALPLLLVVNPVLSHVDGWLVGGWAGPDAEEVQVADYLADRLQAEDKDRAAIGYQTFIYAFMANDHAIDPVYKVGAEFDILLKSHGITNADQCAEGLSPADDYRVVQNRPQSDPDAPTAFFDVQRDGSFRSLGRVGSYEVFRRN